MAKIIVTGGAGFIGSHVVRNLVKEGHEVAVFDAFAQYLTPPVDPIYNKNVDYRFEKLLKGAVIHRVNTLNKDHLRRKIIAEKPEYILHLAALPLANMALEYTEEAFNNIVGGTINILEVLRDVEVKKFVYTSSSMIYGDFRYDPMPEDVRFEPKEIYGGMKLSGEYMVKVYSKRYNIPACILRPSAVYGPTDNNRRVVSLFVTNALTGKPIKVKDADTTFLDFSYVEDVADGMCLVLFRGEPLQAYNVTRGRKRSLKELVEIIRANVPEAEIEYAAGADEFRPERGSLSIEKIKDLGYNPEVDLEEGIGKYVKYMRGIIC